MDDQNKLKIYDSKTEFIIFRSPLLKQNLSDLSGGANSRFLGLVYVGAARSLDQTALRPPVIKRIRQIDVKYITHMQSVHAKCTCKNGNVYKKGRPCKKIYGIRKVQK